MIVRLKAHTKKTTRPEGWEFQFYDSPIKRKTIYVIEREKLAFQFYDSPIKSRQWRCGSRSQKEFQFYDSPIKRIMIRPNGRGQFEGFNSMIVRLKVLQQGVRPYCLKKGFNSMIVRLKDLSTTTTQSMWRGFQFYDSPIKRANS